MNSAQLEIVCLSLDVRRTIKEYNRVRNRPDRRETYGCTAWTRVQVACQRAYIAWEKAVDAELQLEATKENK